MILTQDIDTDAHELPQTDPFRWAGFPSMHEIKNAISTNPLYSPKKGNFQPELGVVSHDQQLIDTEITTLAVKGVLESCRRQNLATASPSP